MFISAVASRKLAEQEKAALKIGSGEAIEDQTEDGVDPEKAEENQDEGKPDTTKKASVSRGESKQSHTSQETGKKAEGKKGAAANKESLAQAVPDLEEDELCRDCAIIAVSMGTAVTGAKLKGASLYEHLAKVSGKEVVYIISFKYFKFHTLFSHVLRRKLHLIEVNAIRRKSTQVRVSPCKS